MVWQEAASGQARPEVRSEVQRIDLGVNKAERFIRRRLAEHIVAQPGADVPACLILMSIVKDAERLGDYCKDILDAAAMETRPLSESARFGDFQELYQNTHGLFEKLQRVLAESDRSLAKEVMLTERDIGRSCDGLLAALASAEEPCSVGIPWALLARYLRRTAAHISNVASSLVMPLHKLDYYDEKWLEGAEEAKPQ